MWYWMSPIRVNVWCADGTAHPPGWPDQALALSERLGTAGPDIVTVPDVAALPPGAVKDVLAAAGVRAWACVRLVRPGRVRGIMGFDAFRPASDGIFPPPVVRLAGDAVANAIEREFLERDRARLRRGWNGRAACRWSDRWQAGLRTTSTTSSAPFSAIRRWPSHCSRLEPSRHDISTRYDAPLSVGAI